MSYARALSKTRLESSDQVAHFEVLDHPEFMRELIGYDPWTDPIKAYVDAYKALDVDWIVDIPRRSIRFGGAESSRKESDGKIYTEWGLSGSCWREDYLFHDIASVLSYDPLGDEQGEELVTVQYNQERIEDRRCSQRLMRDSAIASGIYYTTLFQFPIMVFGWELFLTAAASEPDGFQSVLKGFSEVSRRNLNAWVAEEMDLMLVHDDIAMEEGLVFEPDWYRKRLFPLYEYLLEPVKRNPNLKVAFVSDGNYSEVLDDLVSIGFDGFLINPCQNLGEIARRYSDRLFLVGNVNTTVLTLGTPEDVVQEVKRCLAEGRPAAGHIIRAGGDIPHNIPIENAYAYFEASGRCLR
jgi:hypothetical protein